MGYFSEMRVRNEQMMAPARNAERAKTVGFAGRLRRLDPVLLLAALALGGIGILAVYTAEADYRQLYAVNQALGLLAGVAGAVVLALFDYRRLQ